MKPVVSVVMGYHNRASLLRRTLESYEHHYSDIRDQIELVIVDDGSANRDELPALLQEFKFKFKTYRLDRPGAGSRNPCIAYNKAADMASGDLINLTNPENIHLGPIIKDAIGLAKEGTYLVYACLSLNRSPKKYSDLPRNLSRYVDGNVIDCWYQHSVYNNRLLHFCTFIERGEFEKIGRFDERFAGGSGYDDNDLAQTIVSRGIKINYRDEIYCAHQPHERNWDQESTFKNLGVICEKWGFFPIEKWKVDQEQSQLEAAALSGRKPLFLRG